MTTESILRSYADSLAGSTEAEAAATLTEAEYVSLLLTHDWDYEWCDDYRVWTRGKEQRQRLMQLMAAIDPQGRLWAIHAPHRPFPR